jgi:hypothetical protein
MAVEVSRIEHRRDEIASDFRDAHRRGALLGSRPLATPAAGRRTRRPVASATCCALAVGRSTTRSIRADDASDDPAISCDS